MSENKVLDFRGLVFGCLFALQLKHSNITLLILTSNQEFAACSLQLSQFQLFPQVYLVFWYLMVTDFFHQTLQNSGKSLGICIYIPQQAPSFPAQLLCRIGARIPTSLWMMLGESFQSQVPGGFVDHG